MADRESPPGCTKAKIVFLFFAGFLALQIVVPAALLSEPRPARFGWQMYSALEQVPAFWIVTDDGATTRIDLADEVGNVRFDIDYASKIPPHLCRVRPDAALVRYQRAGATATEEYPCR